MKLPGCRFGVLCERGLFLDWFEAGVIVRNLGVRESFDQSRDLVNIFLHMNGIALDNLKLEIVNLCRKFLEM